MPLKPEQLAGALRDKPLPIVTIIGGDELLLVEEAADVVRKRAKQLEYFEREVWHVDKAFRWSELQDAADSPSLFADKRLLEVRLPNSKPGTEGAKALARYLERPPEDAALLIIAGPLDASARKAKWFKNLESAGTAVMCWPINRQDLPRWIEQRLRSRGLQPEREAVELLAWLTEGNLLALAQDIDKLALSVEPGPLTLEAVRDAVSDSSRHGVFALTGAALAGEPGRVARAMANLRAEADSSPPGIIAMLAYELRDLSQLAARRKPAGRLWPQREQQLRAALGRHSAAAWAALLGECARVDALAKGGGKGNVWDEIERLALAMAGIKLPTARRRVA